MPGAEPSRLLYTLLLSGVVAAVGLSVLVPQATLVAGVLALGCGLVGLTLVGATQRAVGLVLILVGVGSLIVGILLGGSVHGSDLLSVNQDLIGMLAAVSFLRLVTPLAHLARSRLSGRPAVLRTALATHVLGSVINLGAVGIVGDHLRGRAPLKLADAALLSRSYAAGAFWSPFWAAAAAAATLAPSANSVVLLLVGLPMALIALCLSVWGVFRMWGTSSRTTKVTR